MLKSLHIENFKIFDDIWLEFRSITVLTGFNSSGKSSIIQALLLASLAAHENEVCLNGPYGLALGEPFDVLNSNARQNEICLTLVTDTFTELVKLTFPNDRAVTMPANISFDTQSGGDRTGVLIDCYLSAERNGPRDLLELPPSSSVLDVGERGQYTAHVLATEERMRVDLALQHPRAAGQITLAGQVEAWLSDLVRPVRVQATWLAGSNAAMIRFRAGSAPVDETTKPGEIEAPAEWMKPANVGFGLSYALPVVVGGLTARPGGLFIVENPEAHLHPAGQSRMGYFLALVASSGVQVLIETHSEHVVNGIRLAIGRDHRLDAAQAIFHFFGDKRPSALEVSPTGTISRWPQGFFDQSESDLAELSRIRRVK